MALHRKPEIRVKETTNDLIKSRFHDEDTYLMSTPRGRVLIINNDEFDYTGYYNQVQLDYRVGSDLDRDCMETIFKQLDFTVDVKNNLTALRMMEFIESETFNNAHGDYGMFILVVMSHGTENLVYGSDGRAVEYESIYTRLNAKNFKSMSGKPKLIIFQACAGDKKDMDQVEEENAGSGIRDMRNALISRFTDFFIIQASYPGFTAMRDTRRGSYMIQELVNVLMEHACDDTIDNIVTRTRRRVLLRCRDEPEALKKFGIQTIYQSSSLTKSLYLFPGYNPAHDNPTPNIGEPQRQVGDTPLEPASLPGCSYGIRDLIFENHLDTSNGVYSQSYLHDGTLIFGGHEFLTGLTFQPELTTSFITHLVTDRNELFVLVRNEDRHQKYLDVVNLETQQVQKSVLRFEGGGHQYEQMAVSPKHVFITDHKGKCIRMYSRNDYSHVRDIKSYAFGELQSGILALPDETIVVSDYRQHLVSRVSTGKNREILWSVEVHNVDTLALDEQGQTIFCESRVDNKRGIQIITVEGVKQNRIELDRCDIIYDFRVHKDQLAIAQAWTNRVTLYSIVRSTC